MSNVAKFAAWVQSQRDHLPLKTHVRIWTEELKLELDLHEVRSLLNGMYNRLRRSPKDFPMIDYHRIDDRAARDTGKIKYSDNRDLQVLDETIAHNGFSLTETSSALVAAHTSHITATRTQQKTLASVVKHLTTEMAIQSVKVANAEELARRDRQIADDARRDKVFLQEMLLAKTKSSTGSDVV